MIASTAYIDKVVPGRDYTGVKLHSPWGRESVWLPDVQPDHAGAEALKDEHRAVFTVRISSTGPTMGCTVLVASDRGARKVATSIEVGLALCQTGTHGTFRNLARARKSRPLHQVA
jgi:hypothetical protein